MGVDPLIIAGAVVLGLCVGSFLNVCILRLPRDQSLLRPRSTCPHCKQPIALRDNIPLLSWLWLRGKCRWCHKPISIQYPLIEALVGVLFGVSVLVYGLTLQAVAAALFGTILLGIAITDARHYIIPDEFTWGGLVIGLLSLEVDQRLVRAAIDAQLLDRARADARDLHVGTGHEPERVVEHDREVRLLRAVAAAARTFSRLG